MAWATPVTHVTGDVVSASDWNIGTNDLIFLAGTKGSAVDTQETTTSTTYTDLATVGPTVTLTTGTTALVLVGCLASNNTAGDAAIMGYAVSGATTIAAADANTCQVVTTTFNNAALAIFQTGLTAGSNTFTAKYRVTPAGTGTFLRRKITVFPLP